MRMSTLITLLQLCLHLNQQPTSVKPNAFLLDFYILKNFLASTVNLIIMVCLPHYRTATCFRNHWGTCESLAKEM